MKKACLFLYGASAALMIYSTVFQLQHQLYAKLGYLAMALGVQLIGPLVVKGLKLKDAWGLLFWTQLFIAIAMIIGNTLNGYAIPYFDKVLHFSSGILIDRIHDKRRNPHAVDILGRLHLRVMPPRRDVDLMRTDFQDDQNEDRSVCTEGLSPLCPVRYKMQSKELSPVFLGRCPGSVPYGLGFP